MIFNSVTYLLFLFTAVCLYWFLPTRLRLAMLYTSSLIFYGFWRWEFLPFMLFSTYLDYFIGLLLARQQKPKTRRLLLSLSLIGNLGLLFIFKYLAFATENAWAVAKLLGMTTPPPSFDWIVLPLGISFYTFQSISYTIDVYRGFVRAEKDYLLFGVYVMFFPQLIAGPILRFNEVTTQLRVRPRFHLENINSGVRRILYGLFLKTVLADNIGWLVDAGFSTSPASLSALDVWTLAFLFGYQIYFDFSAYSHIAIGSAALMGIRFPENFNFPYSSSSPKQFWKSWHISLSSWIRDYLYLPIAGKQVRDVSTGGLAFASDEATQVTIPKWRFTLALFATWAIMGLWHGARWTFLLWGLYHGCLVYVHRKFGKLTASLPAAFREPAGWVLTLPLVMLSWIFFRALTMTQALSMYAKVFQPEQYFSLGLRENTYVIAAAITAMVLLAQLISRHVIPRLKKFPIVWTGIETLALTLVATLVFVFLRPVSQFIYFQF